MSTRIAVGLTALLMIGNLVSFGALGEILYSTGDHVANVIFFGTLGEVHGDFQWPIAIWMGLVWPVPSFVAWYVLFRRRYAQRRPFWVYPLFVIVLLALVVVLATVFHIGAAAMTSAYGIDSGVPMPR